MKKIGKDDALPRHEAIIALKEIAASRQDPYLANEIEIWIQKSLMQLLRGKRIIKKRSKVSYKLFKS